jgi:hypothetical protein
VTPKRVDLRGLDAEGTLFAAYELLEQLGVRWFMPGDIGRQVPQRPDAILPQQITVQIPSFPARWAAGYASKFGEWQRRLRMGGPRFPSAHGVNMPKDASFALHPEYYALINGKRVNKQLCVSNPGTVAAAITTTRAYFDANPTAIWIGMGPHDGRGFCECDNCKALDGGDWDPFANYMSMTDRYIGFFNQILDGIKDKYPDKIIGFYSYASYNRPPVKVTPNPHIIPAFAPITICRIHDMGNPICPEKDKYQRWLIQEWGKILPNVYDRGYWFNLADPGLLFPMVHRVRTQIPLAHELGITGWRVECLAHWGSELPSLYIAGKLMWNHEADVDALMADFSTSYFGPAAVPMARYFTLINDTVRDADFHTGSSYDIPNLYPPAKRQAFRAELTAATKLAPPGVYADRVRMMSEVLGYTEAFCEMIEKRNAHDWVGAGQALTALGQFRDVLTKYETELVTKKYALQYLSRFFLNTTTQGVERATTKGKVVVGLADEWDFQLDPGKTGEAQQFFSVDLSGGNWGKLRTSSLSWSDQGLRHFKGDGWYRQWLEVPASAKDQQVFLWFGAVDEKATVWVNGMPLGDSPGKAFQPFEMDATKVIKPGERNLVVARVRNDTLNEVGTGGICGPVMFWTPGPKPHVAETGGEDVTPVEFK